jgi:hypothetical protein
MAPPVMSNAVMPSAVMSHGDATLLRCGGCGDSAVVTQGEPDYGPLVHGFLGGHELCRSAVEITRSITAPR